MEQSLKELTKIESSYDPDRLLNYMREKFGLKNDAALARQLEVAPPVISKIRHRKLAIGASLLIRMSDICNVGTRELRDIMGDRRKNYRISSMHTRPAIKDIRPKTEQENYTPDAAYAQAV